MKEEQTSQVNHGPDIQYKPPNASTTYFWDSFREPRRFTGNLPGYTADRSWREYDEWLPLWNNLRYSEVVKKLIYEKGEISILDVGCGYGNGLRLPKDIASKTKRYGITVTDYRSGPTRFHDELRGIQISDGDAHSLTDYYPRGTFDLVVSSFTLYYVNQLIVVPQIIEVMGPEAIALLQGASRPVCEAQPNIKSIGGQENGVSFQKSAGLW